jgi:23S rRNA-intervening sequence protein
MFLKLNHQKPEGASRKSEIERKRFYEISRSSIVEIDAALDIANGLGYLKNYYGSELGGEMVRCFKILTGLIASQKKILIITHPIAIGFTIHHSPFTIHNESHKKSYKITRLS